MHHCIYEDTPIRVAYSSISGFFDGYPLSEALAQVEALVSKAFSNRSWKKEGGNMLFFTRRLEELCMATLTIHFEQGQRQAAILPMQEQPDMTATANYVNPRYGGSGWSCFPRHLSTPQYHNPYKVFKKFAGSVHEMEWKKLLRLLPEFALSKDSMEEMYSLQEVMMIRKRLLEVVEACHLVEVRCGGG